MNRTTTAERVIPRHLFLISESTSSAALTYALAVIPVQLHAKMLLPDVFVSVPQTFAGDCSGDGSDGRAARSPNGSFDFLRENGARIQEREQDTIILKPIFTSASPSDGLHKLEHQLHKRYYACTGTIAPSGATRVLVDIAPKDGRQSTKMRSCRLSLTQSSSP